MPVPGVYPGRDVDDAEVHRRERAERLNRPLGTQIGDRSRRVGLIVLVLAFLAIAAAVVLGWWDVLATAAS